MSLRKFVTLNPHRLTPKTFFKICSTYGKMRTLSFSFVVRYYKWLFKFRQGPLKQIDGIAPNGPDLW